VHEKVVQRGYCSELNALLKPHGVLFAPDPATADRANIGGMIANNAAGMCCAFFWLRLIRVRLMGD